MGSIIGSLFKASSVASNIHRLVGDTKKTKIADFVIDTPLTEILQFGASVTEHPIEDKTTVIDHIFKEPLKVKVEGLITDSPIRIMGLFDQKIQNTNLKANFNDVTSLATDKRSKNAYNLLKNIYEERSLISIVTKLEAFNNMAITNLTFKNSEDTSGGLHFTMELIQVKYAKVKKTNIARKTSPKVARLTATPIEKGNIVKSQSYLKKAYDAVTGWFK